MVDRETPAEKGGAVAETARQTPYELAFAFPAFEAQTFPAIQEEAEVRGVSTHLPGEFLLLGSVGNALRDFMPESAEPTAAGEMLDEFGRLLFQAYHFWRYGKRLLLMEEQLVRRLVDGAPRPGRWELAPPHPAGYLQLPRHLFWAQAEPDLPVEPADGLFWTMVGEEDPLGPPYRRLDTVLVTGIRPGRPGFSTIGVSAELPATEQGHWAEAVARPGGRDFENVLPGGELRSLYSLTTAAEVLKLVSLCFWHLAVHPDAAVAVDPPSAKSGPASAHEPPPSALPYLRVG